MTEEFNTPALPPNRRWLADAAGTRVLLSCADGSEYVVTVERVSDDTDAADSTAASDDSQYAFEVGDGDAP